MSVVFVFIVIIIIAIDDAVGGFIGKEYYRILAPIHNGKFNSHFVLLDAANRIGIDIGIDIDIGIGIALH